MPPRTNAAGRGSGPLARVRRGPRGPAASCLATRPWPTSRRSPTPRGALGVARTTLRRWARDGLVPAARRRAGRPPRSPRPASSRGCASAATRWRRSARAARERPARLRLRRGPVPGARSGDAHARGGAPRDRPRAGADRAHLAAARLHRRRARADLRRRRRAAAPRRRRARGRLPARRAACSSCASTARRSRQIADAEVRLFHLYVHEPLMRDGVAGLEMAEEMEGARRASCCRWPRRSWTTCTSASCTTSSSRTSSATWRPTSRATLDLGRLRVAIAFADLAGYTRLTEEVGRGGGGRRRRALRRGGRARRCPTTPA